MTQFSGAADIQQQLDLLREEHRQLDQTIAQLTLTPPEDQLVIRRLKKRKLNLKDRIAALELQMNPDDYA